MDFMMNRALVILFKFANVYYTLLCNYSINAFTIFNFYALMKQLESFLVNLCFRKMLYYQWFPNWASVCSKFLGTINFWSVSCDKVMHLVLFLIEWSFFFEDYIQINVWDTVKYKRFPLRMRGASKILKWQSLITLEII